MKAFARKEFLPFFSHRRNMIRFPDQWLFFRYHFGLFNGCWKWCFYIALNKMATWMGKMMLNQGIFRGTPIFRQLSSVRYTSVVSQKLTGWEPDSQFMNCNHPQLILPKILHHPQHHPQFSTTIHFYDIRKYLWWLKKHMFITMETPKKHQLWVLALCFAQPHLGSLESFTLNHGAQKMGPVGCQETHRIKESWGWVQLNPRNSKKIMELSS